MSEQTGPLHPRADGEAGAAGRKRNFLSVMIRIALDFGRHGSKHAYNYHKHKLYLHLFNAAPVSGLTLTIARVLYIEHERHNRENEKANFY